MNDQHTILVVDDNSTNLRIVKDVLKDEPYSLMMAISGDAALKFLARRVPDLVLLDLLMPGMSGQETYAAIRQQPGAEEIPVIVLTASDEPEVEAECLNMGASDFITKPIVPEVLKRRIRNILELRDLQLDLKGQLEKKAKEIENLSLQAIEAIVHSIEAKDEITQGHSVRVAAYSQAMAKALGYDEETQRSVFQTAMLHDVGKIGTPDSILKKPGRLTPEEYEIIKRHTTDGADILKSIHSIPYLEDGARYHHERYDGKGYPTGLAGEDIPLIGRILAVADVYDALVSQRHYKRAMTDDEARYELLKNSGAQFDPGIVQTFVHLLEVGVIEEARQSIDERYL